MNSEKPGQIEQIFAQSIASRQNQGNQGVNNSRGAFNQNSNKGANQGFQSNNYYNKNQVKVNKKQETNPLLKHSRFQYNIIDDPQMVDDYDINDKVSVLFLQLKYHIAYPLYIKQRFEDVYRMRKNRNKILLLLNDDKDEHNMINSLMMDCFKFEITLIMCWSFEEAAQYIQTFKSYENKTQTMLEGKQYNQGTTHFEQAVEQVSSMRRVNKTDAKNLLSNYGSIEAIIMAPNYDEFLNIDGIGQNKIDAITQCFRGKFCNPNATKSNH
ncbi:dna excision repair protein ercc-1-like [Stylonychia lemnae]|uniref:Dna excision repair protein ercc-1-like n=1 Tax=Stylonychia lemnae TaxID=5949 RepID=A0A077ZUD1_STYLE|nr:dna excision repair protein ercc-1-like [Stylonychia lemnae]|eukprot:CDW73179.1 dna excision repair protein ercc-1-like [Stylonychia lemnae]